jgi:hypothetical protein
MQIEISNGELVDKVTILSIKLKKIKSKEKQFNVKKELNLLYKKMILLGISESSRLYKTLLQINETLWVIEDKIRLKELNKEFDDEFVQLARSVYIENDKRSEIKKQINLSTRSDLIEEKEYTRYQ